MSMKEFRFGDLTLTIHPLKKCVGNAYFYKSSSTKEEYQKVSELITGALEIEYFEQNGQGKRVWPTLNEGHLQALEVLEKKYRYTA